MRRLEFHNVENLSMMSVSFGTQVLVMSSMRKPKRLTIRGDDERDYMFLVKAGEDLRLDQRIEEVSVVHL